MKDKKIVALTVQDEHYRFLEVHKRKHENKNKKRKITMDNSLSSIFQLARDRFKENNIGIDEICENAKVDRELAEIIFSENVVESISRIISFARVKITLNNNWQFTTHKIIENENSVKIKRIIEPKSHIYYDKSSGSFYSFFIPHKNKSKIKDEDHKQLIINEMAMFLKSHFEKQQEDENN
jgi:hypothetical protein